MIDVSRQLILLHDACVSVRDEAYCSPTVVQAMAAIARHETCLNTCKPFVDKGNYGALQCGAKAVDGVCPEHCFPAKDSSPTSTGASVVYVACFQEHPEEEGARVFAKLLAVQRTGIAAALPSGDARVIAKAMHTAKYFEGFGATVEQRVEGYAQALARNAVLNARDSNTANLILLPPPPVPLVPPEAKGVLLGLAVPLVLALLKSRLSGGAAAGIDEPGRIDT